MSVNARDFLDKAHALMGPGAVKVRGSIKTVGGHLVIDNLWFSCPRGVVELVASSDGSPILLDVEGDRMNLYETEPAETTCMSERTRKLAGSRTLAAKLGWACQNVRNWADIPGGGAILISIVFLLLTATAGPLIMVAFSASLISILIFFAACPIAIMIFWAVIAGGSWMLQRALLSSILSDLSSVSSSYYGGFRINPRNNDIEWKMLLADEHGALTPETVVCLASGYRVMSDSRTL